MVLDKLPDTSAYKTARRGGRLTPDQLVQYEIHNEILRLRSGYWAVHSTEENDVRFDPRDYQLADPVDLRLRAEAEDRDAELAAQTETELADAGWM